tara:strand:- start:29 stop:754 length:726 start_codon:yes stop_codon:yes gene_type:complete
MLYEAAYNTKVGEFGCISHSKYPFLAASPDGINILPESSKYGHMVEIKNIYNRQITGVPKFEYWIQMQLQMETCDLPFCDFVETEIKEYANYQEFIQDGTFSHSELGQKKGVIMTFATASGSVVHEYHPLNLSEESCRNWDRETREKHSEDTWISTSYWRLIQMLVTGVARNQAWFDSVLPRLEHAHHQINLAKDGHNPGALKKVKRQGEGRCVVPGYESNSSNSTTLVIDTSGLAPDPMT